jgi:hypothetical protein
MSQCGDKRKLAADTPYTATSLQEGTMSSTSYADVLYAFAHLAGWVGQIWARLRGQPRQLLDLTTVLST